MRIRDGSSIAAGARRQIGVTPLFGRMKLGNRALALAVAAVDGAAEGAVYLVGGVEGEGGEMAGCARVIRNLVRFERSVKR